jgi:hypothetical protein
MDTLPGTIRQFLASQILRSDYLIVGEAQQARTRLPFELKLERMNELCIARRYRDPRECERARWALYTRLDANGRPAALLLVEAYLPECMLLLPRDLTGDLQHYQQRLAQQVRSRYPAAVKKHSFVHSQLTWKRDRYLVYLPADVHALLVDRDGALLAA